MSRFLWITLGKTANNPRYINKFATNYQQVLGNFAAKMPTYPQAAGENCLTRAALNVIIHSDMCKTAVYLPNTALFAPFFFFCRGNSAEKCGFVVFHTLIFGGVFDEKDFSTQ